MAVCVSRPIAKGISVYRSHPVVLSIQLVKYLRYTQQLILKFTQLSATSFLIKILVALNCVNFSINILAP